MHPREAYASRIHTAEREEEHREDERRRQHAMRCGVDPRYLSAEESAYDHAQGH